jgi:hypothetical protein
VGERPGHFFKKGLGRHSGRGCASQGGLKGLRGEVTDGAAKSFQYRGILLEQFGVVMRKLCTKGVLRHDGNGLDTCIEDHGNVDLCRVLGHYPVS